MKALVLVCSTVTMLAGCSVSSYDTDQRYFIDQCIATGGLPKVYEHPDGDEMVCNERTEP